MNNDNIARYGKRFVQYFWDPMPKNEDPSPIWCLGNCYESQPASSASESADTNTGDSLSAAASDSSRSQVDSAVESEQEHGKEDEGFEKIEQQDEAAGNGWPAPFLDDVESKIWLTYRSGFSTIAKSTDPKATSAMSFSTRLKQIGNQGGFTSDTGWGCMIRSGQSLLANALLMLQLGRGMSLDAPSLTTTLTTTQTGEKAKT